ncbi:hypothetical protein GALMADRAFT_147320 [Galerina marginata CBS 339.88]|uniref:Uncharacterized protein n=1 Tax=Galerina marginata (strain CBS 339.88) TaxID=685588 RepID=A0A067SH96_GALM3|nr:hypothetical protein GALMADRAFT_147320 [Galerina marginata CBS 339.88]
MGCQSCRARRVACPRQRGYFVQCLTSAAHGGWGYLQSPPSGLSADVPENSAEKEADATDGKGHDWDAGHEKNDLGLTRAAAEQALKVLGIKKRTRRSSPKWHLGGGAKAKLKEKKEAKQKSRSRDDSVSDDGSGSGSGSGSESESESESEASDPLKTPPPRAAKLALLDKPPPKRRTRRKAWEIAKDNAGGLTNGTKDAGANVKTGGKVIVKPRVGTVSVSKPKPKPAMPVKVKGKPGRKPKPKPTPTSFSKSNFTSKTPHVKSISSSLSISAKGKSSSTKPISVGSTSSSDSDDLMDIFSSSAPTPEGSPFRGPRINLRQRLTRPTEPGHDPEREAAGLGSGSAARKGKGKEKEKEVGLGTRASHEPSYDEGHLPMAARRLVGGAGHRVGLGVDMYADADSDGYVYPSDVSNEATKSLMRMARGLVPRSRPKQRSMTPPTPLSDALAELMEKGHLMKEGEFMSGGGMRSAEAERTQEEEREEEEEGEEEEEEEEERRDEVVPTALGVVTGDEAARMWAEMEDEEAPQQVEKDVERDEEVSTAFGFMTGNEAARMWEEMMDEDEALQQAEEDVERDGGNPEQPVDAEKDEEEEERNHGGEDDVGPTSDHELDANSEVEQLYTALDQKDAHIARLEARIKELEEHSAKLTCSQASGSGSKLNGRDSDSRVDEASDKEDDEESLNGPLTALQYKLALEQEMMENAWLAEEVVKWKERLVDTLEAHQKLMHFRVAFLAQLGLYTSTLRTHERRLREEQGADTEDMAAAIGRLQGAVDEEVIREEEASGTTARDAKRDVGGSSASATGVEVEKVDGINGKGKRRMREEDMGGDINDFDYPQAQSTSSAQHTRLHSGHERYESISRSNSLNNNAEERGEGPSSLKRARIG